MDAPILAVIGVVIMIASLFMIPIGLPGIWIMIAVLAAGTWYHLVSLTIFLVLVGVALASELVEFFLVRKMSIRYGGSNRAFWGALGGGVIGVLVGAPIPIVGSVIAGLLGSFAGAALVTFAETKELAHARRVGWGVLLGRILSAVVKTSAGIIVLVIGGAALVLT